MVARPRRDVDDPDRAEYIDHVSAPGVVRTRDEFAGEGLGEDRLAEAAGAGEVRCDEGFEFVDDRQPPLDLGDDSILFIDLRVRKGNVRNCSRGQVLHCVRGQVLHCDRRCVGIDGGEIPGKHPSQERLSVSVLIRNDPADSLVEQSWFALPKGAVKVSVHADDSIPSLYYETLFVVAGVASVGEAAYDVTDSDQRHPLSLGEKLR